MNVKQFHMKYLWALIHPEMFLLPYKKKKAEMSKLTLRVKLYNILNYNMDGFYDSPTIMTINKLLTNNLGFVIIDANGNVVYNFKNQKPSASTELNLDLDAGIYHIKFLFSINMGIVGGEIQQITVDGETTFDILLYTRHFKTVSIVDDCETYDGYESFYGWYPSGNASMTAKNIPKMDIYELKWDTWTKIITYNTAQDARTITITTSYEVVPQKGLSGPTISYIKACRLAYTGQAYGYDGNLASSTSSVFVGYELYDENLSDNVKYDFSEDDLNMMRLVYKDTNLLNGNVTKTYNEINPLLEYFRKQPERLTAAMKLYQFKKDYADVDSVDSDFFSEYSGSVLFKYSYNENISYNSISNYSYYNQYLNTPYYTPLKTYFPAITFMDNDFQKERYNSVRFSSNEEFWRENTSLSGAASVYENGDVVQYDNGVTVFDYLSTTVIGTSDSPIFWYSDDYAEFYEEE